MLNGLRLGLKILVERWKVMRIEGLEEWEGEHIPSSPSSFPSFFVFLFSHSAWHQERTQLSIFWGFIVAHTWGKGIRMGGTVIDVLKKCSAKFSTMHSDYWLWVFNVRYALNAPALCGLKNHVTVLSQLGFDLHLIAPIFNPLYYWFVSFLAFLLIVLILQKTLESTAHRRAPLDLMLIIVVHRRAPPTLSTALSSLIAFGGLISRSSLLSHRLRRSHRCLLAAVSFFIVCGSLLRCPHQLFSLSPLAVLSSNTNISIPLRSLLYELLDYFLVHFIEAMWWGHVHWFICRSAMARQLDRSCVHLLGNHFAHNIK